MSVQVFVDVTDFSSQYDSPEDYVACQEIGRDGVEFELVRMDVISKTKFRMLGGVPVPVEIAFPEDEVGKHG